MSIVRFYLKAPKAVFKSAIYVDFSYDGYRLKIPAGLSIEPQSWSTHKQFPKSQIENYSVYRTRLVKIKGIIEKYYLEEKANGIIPKPDTIKQYLTKALEESPQPKNSQSDFVLRFNEYIKVKSTTQAVRSVMIYKQVLAELISFSSLLQQELTFKNIDLVFYDSYIGYLLSKENTNANCKIDVGMLNDTIAKRISNLKTFMRWAHEREYHNNLNYQKFRYSKSQKNEIVSLKEYELKKVIKLNLSKNKKLERVKDIFLFGVFTGQRWSDVVNFNQADIQDNAWVFTSKKTKKLTVVPFTGFCGNALPILKKYDYKLPIISGQKFNEYLKDVGELAGLSDEVVLNRYSGKEHVRLSEPKYKFMSSHMARRTCVTILLEKGVPATTIMKLTGHTDLKMLLKYENTSQEALIKALKTIKI